MRAMVTKHSGTLLDQVQIERMKAARRLNKVFDVAKNYRNKIRPDQTREKAETSPPPTQPHNK